VEKPPRPQKKYKVNSDVEKWQEQRKLLAYQIVSEVKKKNYVAG